MNLDMVGLATADKAVRRSVRLVVNEAGRQRQKYIPNSQVEAAREGLATELLCVDRGVPI